MKINALSYMHPSFQETVRGDVHTVTSKPIRTMRKTTVPYLLLRPLFRYLITEASSTAEKPFFSQLFNSDSELIRTIQQIGGTGPSLHLLYCLPELVKMNRSRANLRERLQEWVWLNIPTIQGVQNRTVVIRELLHRAVMEQHERNEPIRILSIAAGTAEPLLWGIRELEGADIGIEHILLTDCDRETLALAAEICHELEVKTPVEVRLLDLRELLRAGALIHENRATIVEAIGYIDYLNDRQVSRFLTTVRTHLPEGSLFITGNVAPNGRVPEDREFIHAVYHWPPMHYRDPEELRVLLADAGFSRIEIRVEPQHIFAVALAGV